MLTRCGRDLPIEDVEAHQKMCWKCRGGAHPHPPGSHHDIDYFSDAEAVEVLSSCDKEHWKLVFWLQWVTGCRIGEALMLRRRDLDLPNKSVQITREKKRGDKFVKMWMPITSDLADELERYTVLMKRQSLFPFRVNSAEAALKRAAVRAGIARPVRTHMWRHGFGKRLARGIDRPREDAESIIQGALGHSSRKYVHVYTDSSARDVIEEIRKVIGD